MYRLFKNTGLKIDFRGSYLHDSWANMNLIMQSLKFVSELVPLVLSGEKNCTWRLFNDKEFKVNEIINLVKRPELKIFASAKIISVTNKKFKDLENTDFEGHEKFESTQKMYETYEGYYGKIVGKETEVTIIRFKLISK